MPGPDGDNDTVSSVGFHHKSYAVVGERTAYEGGQRVGRERFKIHLWDVIRHDPRRPRDEENLRVTAAIAAALERALRAYPEQWLWALRRWETRPVGEVPGPDGLPARSEQSIDRPDPAQDHDHDDKPSFTEITLDVKH